MKHYGKSQHIFKAAQPVWPAGKTREMNLTVGFRAILSKPQNSEVYLQLAASSHYRCFINGRLFGHGPARGPHGHYRVDRWDLSRHLKNGINVIAVEVVGYNVNSYYLLDQASFLQAEVVVNEVPTVYTGVDTGFSLHLLQQRLQKVHRYSFQRTFTEVYRMKAEDGRWREEPDYPLDDTLCEVLPAGICIPRGVPYPALQSISPEKIVCEGKAVYHKKENYWSSRFITGIGAALKGFDDSEVEWAPVNELQDYQTIASNRMSQPYLRDAAIVLNNNQYCLFDFGINRAGFPGARVHCLSPARVYFIFDEVLTEQDVDFTRLDCINITAYDLEPGDYVLEAMEPYTMRYLKVLVLEGACSVSNVYLREYANPNGVKALFSCSDPDINRIFDAGRETWRQNAVDTFMDNPSRERAGWSFDSFFTARTALYLSGHTQVERTFLENYLLPKGFDNIPDGMLPMCYPADHPDGVFIPNWCLWFILQLEEYCKRSGDTQLAAQFKEKILGILQYLEDYKNEEGLLENLPGWVFVEWSKANDFVRDVNYPVNMTYAAALAAAGRLYDMPTLLDESAALNKVIHARSFDGTFFTDNGLRRDGQLIATKNRSEVCQYYAFFFGLATPKSHASLWECLVKKFGPGRGEDDAYPDVHPANIIIGIYLRLELLSRFGHTDRIPQEIHQYFNYMAEKTGTLWEHTDQRAGCSQGLASHVVYALYRDVLGIQEIDTRNRIISVHFPETTLNWCQGCIPVEGDETTLSIGWEKRGSVIHYSIKLPDGYDIELSCGTGFDLVETGEPLITAGC